MTFVTKLLRNIDRYKHDIDALLESMENSRVNYILRSEDAFRRTIGFLKGDESETMDAVLKHRFYFEIKLKKVIST